MSSHPFRMTLSLYFTACLIIANVYSHKYRQHVNTLPIKKKCIIHDLTRYNVEMFNFSITMNSCFLVLNKLLGLTFPIAFIQVFSHITSGITLAFMLNFLCLMACKVMLTIPSGFAIIFNKDQDLLARRTMLVIGTVSGLISLSLCTISVILAPDTSSLPFMYAEMLSPENRAKVNFGVSPNWKILVVMSGLLAVNLVVSYLTRAYLLRAQLKRSPSIQAAENPPSLSLADRPRTPNLGRKLISYKVLGLVSLALLLPVITMTALILMDGDRSTSLQAMVRMGGTTALIVMYGWGKDREKGVDNIRRTNKVRPSSSVPEV